MIVVLRGHQRRDFYWAEERWMQYGLNKQQIQDEDRSTIPGGAAVSLVPGGAAVRLEKNGSRRQHHVWRRRRQRHFWRRRLGDAHWADDGDEAVACPWTNSGQLMMEGDPREPQTFRR